MLAVISRLALVLMMLVVAGPLAAADEWRPLFDGKSLDGWVQKGGAAKYRAEDGQIVGTSVPNTSNSFLCTTNTTKAAAAGSTT